MSGIVNRRVPPGVAEKLIKDGMHPVLARLYASRGLTDARELSSELAALMPPSGLLHIDAAALRLRQVVELVARHLVAARTLADQVSAERLAGGSIYPAVEDLRPVSGAVGLAVDNIISGKILQPRRTNLLIGISDWSSKLFTE